MSEDESGQLDLLFSANSSNEMFDINVMTSDLACSEGLIQLATMAKRTMIGIRF